MSINEIYIWNHNGFDEMKISFSNGCNIFIGENATGKTQILKMLNANDLELRTNLNFFNNEELVKTKTYIPVKDMLTHSKGFISMSEKYIEFPFEQELVDIVRKAEQWKVKGIPKIAKNILPKLESMMEGKVIYENEEFYILKKDGLKIPFEQEAEGYKKIGLIWQLLMTENITENSVLLWDEPESNINPKFIPDLVEILLELSSNKVQIFLTTHSYIFAKYFEIRSKSSHNILFHSLYRNSKNLISCESNKTFSDLKHNSIMNSFEKLLDEVYDLDTGE